MKISRALIHVLLLLPWETRGFLSSQVASTTTRNSLSLHMSISTQDPQQEKEDMKRSIEAMREEAKKRLNILSQEFSDYKGEVESHHEHPSPEEQALMEHQSTLITATMNADNKSTTKQQQQQPKQETTKKNNNNKTNLKVDLSEAERLTDSSMVLDLNQPLQVPHADVNRLDDTRWKIVFDLGREPGTWMPVTWAASGDRLRFSLVVDLTDQPFHDREEFFDGAAGAKVLNVVEASLGPTFWDSDYHGQQQIKVKPTGAYKVLRGSGPLKTDTLRLFVEIDQEIVKSAKSDVTCPKGRIYGNCGYFPVYTSLSKEGKEHRKWRDILQEKYKALANQYAQLEQEAEEDTRLFSLEQLTRMKEIMDTRNVMNRLEKRIQELKLTEPSRGQLRLSRKGDVGLSREGGVCLKVQKGLAVEYHILGRMEVSAMDKEIPKDHEDFEDLKHKLHP